MTALSVAVSLPHPIEAESSLLSHMPRLILFNKPHGVICQFSPSPGKLTLKDFIDLPDVYPADR